MAGGIYNPQVAPKHLSWSLEKVGHLTSCPITLWSLSGVDSWTQPTVVERFVSYVRVPTAEPGSIVETGSSHGSGWPQ